MRISSRGGRGEEARKSVEILSKKINSKNYFWLLALHFLHFRIHMTIFTIKCFQGGKWLFICPTANGPQHFFNTLLHCLVTVGHLIPLKITLKLSFLCFFFLKVNQSSNTRNTYIFNSFSHIQPSQIFHYSQ